MSDQGTVQFLDVAAYRQKRLIDASRLIAFVGAVVLLFPLPFFFAGGEGDGVVLSVALYLFGVWLALILLAFALSRHLREPAGRD